MSLSFLGNLQARAGMAEKRPLKTSISCSCELRYVSVMLSWMQKTNIHFSS